MRPMRLECGQAVPEQNLNGFYAEMKGYMLHYALITAIVKLLATATSLFYFE